MLTVQDTSAFWMKRWKSCFVMSVWVFSLVDCQSWPFAATPLCGGRSTAATWSKGPPGSRTEGPCPSLTRWKTTWESGGEKPHLCLIRTRVSSQLHRSPGSYFIILSCNPIVISMRALSNVLGTDHIITIVLMWDVFPDDIVLVGDLLSFNKVFNFPKTSTSHFVCSSKLWISVDKTPQKNSCCGTQVNKNMRILSIMCFKQTPMHIVQCGSPFQALCAVCQSVHHLHDFTIISVKVLFV